MPYKNETKSTTAPAVYTAKNAKKKKKKLSICIYEENKLRVSVKRQFEK